MPKLKNISGFELQLRAFDDLLVRPGETVDLRGKLEEGDGCVIINGLAYSSQVWEPVKEKASK